MTIGSLAVTIVANTERFTRGLNSARRQVSIFQRGLSSLKVAVAGFGAALAAGFTIRGLARTADEIDRIAKKADTLGIGTERLLGLGRAADLAGSDFQSLTTGLAHMERNLSKGASAFKKLNLDLGVLRHLSPEVQFGKIADAIRSMPDPGARLQAARDIFGRGGEGLMPLMMEGSEKMRRQTALTSGFSRGDASGVEGVNDAFTSVKHSLSDLGTTLLMKFGPSVEAATKRLNGMAGGADIEKVGKWTGELNKLSDSKFAAFRTAWSGTGSSARSDAGQKFLGVSGAHMQATQIDAAIREREMLMSERHQESVAGAIRSDDLRRAAGGGSAGAIGPLQMMVPQLLEMHRSMAGQAMGLKTGLSMFGGIGMGQGSEGTAGKALREQWKGEADSITQSMLTPLQKTQQELEKGLGFFQKGLISPETLGSLVTARDEAMTMAAEEANKRQPALEALVGGSKEAFTAARENLRPRKGKDPNETTAENTKKANELLGKIAGGIVQLTQGNFAGAQVIGAAISG